MSATPEHLLIDIMTWRHDDYYTLIIQIFTSRQSWHAERLQHYSRALIIYYLRRMHLYIRLPI